MVNRKTRSFANKLVVLSMEKGQVSQERVNAVLHLLKEKPPRNYRELLEVYYVKISAEIRKGCADIEYAGSLQESTLNQLKDSLSKHYNRDLTISLTENPTLLAGFRVYVADDVWDASAAGRLQSISHKFKQAI